jgi:hypothetical protein
VTEDVTPSSVSTTTEAPIDCGSIETGFIPHVDCTKYYNCTNYVGIVYRCEIGLLWNTDINECDFPGSVPGKK